MVDFCSSFIQYIICFSLLDEHQQTLDEVSLDDRSQVQKILQKMEIFEHRYRLGISQILLRADLLMELEEKRDMALCGLISSLQAHCRQTLARLWLAKRRVQEIAIKCIQRNARLHFRLKTWAWWNLYLRVKPLLSAVRFNFNLQKIKKMYFFIDCSIIKI